MIKFLRLDDRLIHGQVATTWIRTVGAGSVLEVDSRTASQDMLKYLQRMSCPKDIKLKILNAEDAVNAINGPLKEKVFFLLVGNVKDLHTLVMGCDEIKSIELGNLGYREGKENLINRLFVTAEERELLKEIGDKGVELYAQMLPSDTKDPVNPLLR